MRSVIFCIFLFLSYGVYAEPTPEPHKLTFDLVLQVETSFLDKTLQKNFPWEKDAFFVGCGWIKIKYLGYEGKDDTERSTYVVNIPIGQSCGFSEYLATPQKKLKLDVVKWGDEYYFDRNTVKK